MHPTLRRIHQLAANEPDSHRQKATYYLYAYRLIPLIDEPEFSTYVGETGKSINQRYSEHADGSRTCCPVRKGHYQVGPLLRDVMEALPSFKCRACVEQAEGLLADYFDETEGGAYSNNGQSAQLRRNEQEAVNA
jgi:hypothetical protein